MAVVTIPSNFDELPEPVRRSVVPICLNDVDDRGLAIPHGWIDAVHRVAEPLRLLAKRRLGDVWMVSELTETSVHALAKRHGEDLGRHPHRRIYARARFDAEDLRRVDWRNRRGKVIAPGTLDHFVDPQNYESLYIQELSIRKAEEFLKENKQEDLVAALDCMRRGLQWESIGEEVDVKWPNLKRRWSRWMSRFRDQV